MAIIIRCLTVLLKGLRFAAPFLLGVAPLFIAGGATVYGVFSWVYSFISDNISSIENVFQSATDAVTSFSHTFTSSTIGQNIAYACATDTLLTVFATFVGIVFAVVSFLTIAIIAGLVGIFVKLIVAQLVSKTSKMISTSSDIPGVSS